MISSIQKLSREIKILTYTVMFITLINIFLIGVIWDYTRTNIELENTQAELMIAEHEYINNFLESLKPVVTGKETSATGKKSDISYRSGK